MPRGSEHITCKKKRIRIKWLNLVKIKEIEGKERERQIERGEGEWVASAKKTRKERFVNCCVDCTPILGPDK